MDSRQEDQKRAMVALLSNEKSTQLLNTYFDKSNKATQDLLAEIYPRENYDIKRVGQNNANYIISQKDKTTNKIDPAVQIVVQISERDIAAEVAMAQLSQRKPVWLPSLYTVQARQAGGNERLEQTNHNKLNLPQLNQFARERVGTVIIMEGLFPLTKRIENLHNNFSQREAIELTQRVGTQISNIYSMTSANNIIWSDLKPGNILLRKQDQVVIADTKGFTPVDMLAMRIYKGQTIVSFPDVTPSYVSTHFGNNAEISTPDRNQAKIAWEQEYSFQMSLVLFKTATNQDRYGNTNDEQFGKFHFDHPVFTAPNSTPEEKMAGRNLQTIIEKLGHEDPKQRIHHTDASELLNLINNQKEFDAKLAQTKPLQETITQIVEQNNDRKINPAIYSSIVAPQKFYTLDKNVDLSSSNHKIDFAIRIYNHYTNVQPPVTDTNFKFTHDVFQSEKGHVLKDVIQKLSLEKSKDRISVDSALKTLKELSQAAPEVALKPAALTSAASSTSIMFRQLASPQKSGSRISEQYSNSSKLAPRTTPERDISPAPKAVEKPAAAVENKAEDKTKEKLKERHSSTPMRINRP